MTLLKFKAVFFDAGGTLLHPYPSVGEIYQRVGAKHGCGATSEELQSRFTECWRELEGLSKLTGNCNEKIERDWWRELVHQVFSRFGGIQDFEGFFTELYDVFAGPEAWRLYPEVEKVLSTLRRQNKKMIVVSNWDSRLFQLLENLNISSYFDAVLASAVFGASKPNARIFEEALRLAEVDPHEAVHIGDSYEDDIKGANSARIQGVLIDRHGHHDLESVMPVMPLRTVKDLAELL